MSKKGEYRHTEGILVNRLDFRVNEVEFDRKYTILHAEYAAPEKKREAVRLLNGFSTVKAIKYGFGNTSFFILLNGKTEKEAIIETLNTIVLDEPVRERRYNQVSKNVALDLMLIGLSHEDSGNEEGDPTYSNLDGGLYTFEPEDVKSDRVITFNMKSRKAKDCIELFGDTQVLISAQTFASTKRMQEHPNDRKLLKSLPRFQIYDNRYMKLSNGNVFEPDKEEYVKHGYHGMKKKASIDFLDISGVDNFDRCKMGRTLRTLKRMHREYKDIGLEIGFVRTNLFDLNRYRKKNSKFEDYLRSLWNGGTIHIVDKVNSPTSRSIVHGITVDMKNTFNVNVIPADEVIRGDFTIVVVQSNIRDPNHRTYDDSMVQHISVKNYGKTYYREDPLKQRELFESIENEKISNGRKSNLVMILSDFIIKKDIIQSTQTYFNWFKENILDVEPVNVLDRKWQFYNRVRVENPDSEHQMEAKFCDKMGCLEMDVDGNMKYMIIEESEVKDDFHLQLIWNQFNKGQSNIKGVFSDGDNTFAIMPTDVRMIPETELIRQKLRDNKKAHTEDSSTSLTGGIRTRGDYELYLKACTDIRYAHVKNDCYYFVGVRSDTINSTLHWCAGLMRIKRLEGTEKVPEAIFDMMLAPFVRLNRFTIVPYPFKYLHEYEKTMGLENYVPEEPSEEETGKDKENQWTLDMF